MNTLTAGINISPVNMEDRQKLGIKAGDTVRVHQKIQDKGKTRIQVFEGIVLARKHGNEAGATFTVRKVVDGIGVEKIFPLYSPLIDKIEITRRSKVRRAKLYYIREKVAREIKRQMRRMRLVTLASESDAEAKIREDAAAEAKLAEEAEQAETEPETPKEEVATEEVATEAEVPEEEKKG
jgi:large subunit ribosomal protein L19